MSGFDSTTGKMRATEAVKNSDVFRTAGRYAAVPRTLSFIFNGESVLLLRGDEKKWFAGRMNGVGGHVEPGESVLASACREVEEETGLAIADLQLRTVLHCMGGTGAVMMFVFSGTSDSRDVRQSEEGRLEWAPLARLDKLPVLDDIRPILEQIRNTNAVSFGTIEYSADGRLQQIEFEESCVSAPI